MAGLAVGACSEGPTGGDGTGRLRVQLTDAPGDLEEAFVKFSEIVLIRSEEGQPEAGRVVIQPDVTGYINLLELTGGRVSELADESGIPLGRYSQLRLVIDEAYVTLKDGRVFATSGAELPAGVEADGTLKCPSCSQSGFKVQFAGDGMTVAENSTVVIDFDAGKSFGHEAGRSGQWIMHPVLRATATTIRFGSINGTVTLATGVTLPTCGAQPNKLSIFRPLAVAGVDSISAATDTLGAYRVGGLMPGTYTMDFVKDYTFTNGDSLTIAATATPASVTVAEGDSVTSNYQITAASCH
jgi:hypothetical protein